MLAITFHSQFNQESQTRILLLFVLLLLVSFSLVEGNNTTDFLLFQWGQKKALSAFRESEAKDGVRSYSFSCGSLLHLKFT